MTRLLLCVSIGALTAACGLQASLNGAASPGAPHTSIGSSSTSNGGSPQARSYKTIKTPKLADLPLAAAKRVLRQAGFTGRISIQENEGCGFSRPMTARAVCRTRPHPGIMINRHITLLLSGPEAGSDGNGRYTKVPNMFGWTSKRAKAQLAKLGFTRVGTDTTFKARNKKQKHACSPGHVCFQRPLPGVKRHLKHDIRLTLGETP